MFQVKFKYKPGLHELYRAKKTQSESTFRKRVGTRRGSLVGLRTGIFRQIWRWVVPTHFGMAHLADLSERLGGSGLGPQLQDPLGREACLAAQVDQLLAHSRTGALPR